MESSYIKQEGEQQGRGVGFKPMLEIGTTEKRKGTSRGKKNQEVDQCGEGKGGAVNVKGGDQNKRKRDGERKGSSHIDIHVQVI